MSVKNGIPIQSGFSLGTAVPLDLRTIVETENQLIELSEDILYKGIIVYCKENDKYYKWNGTSFTDTSLSPSTIVPLMNGDPSAGNNTSMYALPDHVHPHDTTRLSVDDFNKFKSHKITASDGLSGSGSLDDESIEISHAVKPTEGTSVTERTNDNGNNVVLDVNIDKYGHISSLKTRDIYDKYSNSTPTYASLGGIPEGTTFEDKPVTDVLNMLLYPYMKPSISFNISPTAGVNEYGHSISSITLTANIVKKSNKITGIQFIKNDSDYGDLVTNKQDGGTIETTDSNINDSTTYNVKVTDDSGKSYYGSSKTYTFVYPAFVGLIDTDNPSETQIKQLNKLVMSPANYKFSTGEFTSKRICIACPPGWEIKQFVDSNGFDNTSSFNSIDVNITNDDLKVNKYKVYFNGVSSQKDGFSMTFNKK